MTTSRNSRVLRTIPLLIAVCFVSLPAQAQYGGGSGSARRPYLIYTAEQMNEIGANRNDWDKHFRLMEDIDLSAYTGTSFNIIGSMYSSFRGVFDGNGHTISNFSYISTDVNRIGLFGNVQGENALIKDLGLINPNVDVGITVPWFIGQEIGSLVGNLQGGTITNCYADGGSVSGNDYVGGLVGNSYFYGTITNCTSSASVSGNDYVGGLVGENGYYSTITNCFAAGSVSGSGADEWWPGGVGGLVGYNEGRITNCTSSASVSGNYYVGGLVGNNSYFGTIICSDASNTVTGDISVGGLAGYNDNILTHCYATGSVAGTTNVGGLVGENDYGTITNCYATVSVTGTTDVGGLVGAVNQWGMGEVTFSFWDIQTSGQSTSAGGTGKTTAEMQNPNTFIDAGWDFVDKSDGPSDVWAEPAGGGYPILWWQLTPLPELPT
ncbi:MAG: hypothetical protein GY774_38880, partial [Planctomycetes bacterium]|nr:hypothetical protein [Planctomycetota bacterium]